MDDNILEQLTGDPAKDYLFATVAAVSTSGLLTVNTVSGLQLTIRDNDQTYRVDDQIILAAPGNDLNNIFIIRKTDKLYPAAVNLVIDNDED
ncbi:MAG: hypothetical protein KOO65_11830 [Desulfobacterales bacterium]|nr:hypothetical protein [Desulfobacterales bacterium]